jgi:hypothetical protein
MENLKSLLKNMVIDAFCTPENKIIAERKKEWWDNFNEDLYKSYLQRKNYI